MFSFNITDTVTSLAGMAGLGNLISLYNNLKQYEESAKNIWYELENYKYSIEQYKADVEQYFDDVKTDIEDIKNIKSIMMTKIEAMETEYNALLERLKFKKKKTIIEKLGLKRKNTLI
jgi:DNA repair ATPase RecN